MDLNVQIPAIVSAVLFLFIAVFQILLAFGAPLGEYSWGGKHNGVLPMRLRIGSLLSSILLAGMAFVLLIHTKMLSITSDSIPTHLLVWIITIFMALNTLGNLASQSKMEKRVMTPLTAIAFVSCLLIALSS